MRLQRPRWGRMLISCPLLLQLVSGCDSPPPSFVETPAEDLLAEGTPDPSGEGRSGEDAERDDHTPADRGELDRGPLKPYAQWNFLASQMEKGSLALDVSGGRLEQRFAMESNVVAQTMNFTQLSRPVSTEAFTQGSVQAQKQEVFDQNASPSGLLDILVVMDNSGSMKEEQVNLAPKILPLLSYVQDSDWKIGVVTTDPSEGCLRGLVRKGDAQASTLFSQAIQAGTQGSGNERGILQAVNGLKGECNPGGSWLRSQSTLAVLVVSDEDNCSNGTDCGSDPWSQSAYLVDHLASIRQVGTNARVYGLIWHPTQTQSACNSGYNRGRIYADAIGRTGGTWGSICDKDYTKTLQAISQDLSTILKTQFALQFTPSSGSLKVYVDGLLQSSGYQLRGNVVEFTQAPAAGAKIQVDYSFAVQPPKREFTLAQEADATTLQVYLDGNLSSAYQYDASSRTIRFSQAPDVREIKAVYRRPGELKKEFALGSRVQVDSLKVKVNQELLPASAYSYQASRGVLVFNQSPKDQAAVEVSFHQVQDPRLRYPLYATDSQKSQLRVYDGQTGVELPVQMQGDELVFSSAQYRALRPIVVRYPLQGVESRVIELGYNYIPSSVEVKGLRSGVCKTAQINESTIDMSSCFFVMDEAIEVSFSYEKQHQTVFDLGQLDVNLSQYQWKVLINGVATTDYRIDEHRLEFASLPFNATVDVALIPR